MSRVARRPGSSRSLGPPLTHSEHSRPVSLSYVAGEFWPPTGLVASESCLVKGHVYTSFTERKRAAELLLSREMLLADHASPSACADTEREVERGCEHYKRGCKLRAPCCGELFSCRFCHDKVKSDGEKDFSLKHNMNRHNVQSVVCLACQEEQAPGPACTHCGAQ